jgi:hypothetical protein
MQVGIRTFAAVALVALLVPVAAVAKDAKVKGPTALVGAGFFGGELELAMAEEGQRPVKIVGRAGYVGVLDLGGDLKIRCLGKGRVQKKETEEGNVYFCGGRRAGQVTLLGSHFKLRGQAAHYRALLPAGATGSFHGRFVQCDLGEEASACGPTRERERPKTERPKTERPKTERTEPTERGEGRQKPAPAPAEEDDEEIPTLAELAALLAGK